MRQLQRLRSKTPLFILALSLASSAWSLSADTKPEDLSRKQVEFGIDVARLGLWREAVYRWQRAVELDSTNASARNNLGVAYEQAGQFDLAEEQYQRALELDTNNVHIRQNYELFREAYEKRKRKDGGSTP